MNGVFNVLLISAVGEVDKLIDHRFNRIGSGFCFGTYVKSNRNEFTRCAESFVGHDDADADRTGNGTAVDNYSSTEILCCLNNVAVHYAE